MTDRLIRELEALRVGPDEVLIVKMADDFPWDECDQDEIAASLAEAGLGGRSIVFQGGVEFAVVKRDPSTEGEPR